MQSNYCIQVQDLVPGESFREHVSRHIISLDIVNINESLSHSMTDEVVADIDVLHLGMVLIVLGNGDGRNVVKADCDGFFKWACNFCQKCAKLECFLCSMSHSDVLSFGS